MASPIHRRESSFSFIESPEKTHSAVEKLLSRRDVDQATIELAKRILRDADDQEIWGMGELGCSFRSYERSCELAKKEDWRALTEGLIKKAERTLACAKKDARPRNQ